MDARYFTNVSPPHFMISDEKIDAYDESLAVLEEDRFS